ncbi:MAG: HD domain-containing protein [Treponema sp.]|nr:HD domain-containing protein [Treponema sp.]
MFNHIHIPAVLQKMNAIFVQHGYEAYLVGGAVRDTLLGKKASDLDIATNATPEQVMTIFHKVIPTGIAHGTVTIHFMGEEIETTTFRTESDYSDGRHPDKVAYAATIEEDLSRRDFTMNAIAASLKDGAIVDPFNGQDDIKRKYIRTVGNPLERFSEDGLRPIRALRFASQLNFTIDDNTFKAIEDNSIRDKIKNISIERFRDEFVKILSSKKPSVGLALLEQTGIMDIFIPELKACRNCIQSDVRGFHEFDVANHLFYSCDGAPREKLNVRLAALFHDVGKPDVKRIEKIDEGEIFTFYNHEGVSAEKTREILFRLKFPNSLIDNVVHLVKNHMFYYEPKWTDAAVRRFIMRIKAENIEDLFDLRLADVYGMHNTAVVANSETVANLNELSDRIKKIESEHTAISLKSLAVNGNDLIKIGIPAGKKIGFILNELLETVLDDPSENTKEKLLLIAENIKNKAF